MIETRELPCYNGAGMPPVMYAYTGDARNPFFIHRSAPDLFLERLPRGNWTITHMATGYAVVTARRSRLVAIRTANALAELGCWDFYSPDQAKELDPAIREQIKAVIARCA